MSLFLPNQNITSTPEVKDDPLRKEFDQVSDQFVNVFNSIDNTKYYELCVKFRNLYNSLDQKNLLTDDISASLKTYEQLKVVEKDYDLDYDLQGIRTALLTKEASIEIINEMKEFMRLKPDLDSIRRTITLFLEKFFEKYQTLLTKNADHRKIESINQMVTDLHNMDNTEDTTVYQLWSDGEVLFTKGNGLYGHRSFFQHESPMTLPKGLKFPLSKTGQKETYALLKGGECDKIRQMMRSLQ